MSQTPKDRDRRPDSSKGGATRRDSAGRAEQPTVEKVAAHFQQPQRYLGCGVHIGVRRQMVKELLGEPTQKSTFDIGCGDGSIPLQFLSDSIRLTLVDLSPDMLEICRRSAPDEFADRVTFVNTNFVEHEFSEQFDIVLCIGVLAHVTEMEPAIAKLGTLLKPGGDCIVQMTDGGGLVGRVLYGSEIWYGRLMRGDGDSTNRMTADEIVTLAERHGLVLAGERRIESRAADACPRRPLQRSDHANRRPVAPGRRRLQTRPCAGTPWSSRRGTRRASDVRGPIIRKSVAGTTRTTSRARLGSVVPSARRS